MAFPLSFMLRKLREETAENEFSEIEEKESQNEDRESPQIKEKELSENESLVKKENPSSINCDLPILMSSEKELQSDVSETLNVIVSGVCDESHLEDNTEVITPYEINAHDLDCNVGNNEIYDDQEMCTVDPEVQNDSYISPQILDFSHTPIQINGAWTEFSNTAKNNYTRGCKWAPDGSCILTCSDDNNLRLFNLPLELWDTTKWQDMSEMMSVLKFSEGEIIYDYSWYPLMSSVDPCTCCFISTSKNSTVHLWDAFTGELRCSYRAYDQMDEITAARSLSFDVDGSRIFCGFEKIIRVFDINRPGRKCEERRIFNKKSGQSGIISCFAFSPADRNISAAGSYQRTIGIYSEPDGMLECVVQGHTGGITHLQFSPDGNLLYSGARKDSDILCWDVRNLGEVLYTMRRCCVTNQRMYFDISRDGRYVISGNTNGVISIWDTTQIPKEVSLDDYKVLEPTKFFLAHKDCVNGISIHPSYPLLCSSSGQRKFPELLSEDDDGVFSSKTKKSDNSLRLWWIGEGS